MSFAISVNDVKQIISDLMDKVYISGRAHLGVYTQNVTLVRAPSIPPVDVVIWGEIK